MTLPEAMALLRELQALDKVTASISEHGGFENRYEWQCVTVALRDRRIWLTHCRDGEDPALIARAEVLVRGHNTPRPAGITEPDLIADVPEPWRVH